MSGLNEAEKLKDRMKKRKIQRMGTLLMYCH